MSEPKFLSSIQEEAKSAFNFELKDADSSALRFISLHEKFCRHLTTASLKIREAEKTVSKVRKSKHDWYVREYEVRLDRKELEHYVNSDEEVVKAEDNLAYWKTAAKYIEGVLDGINRSSFNVGNAIKWAMFKAGAN